MKKCSKCKQKKDKKEFYDKCGQCKACKVATAQALRVQRREEARTDITPHDYGKSKLPEGFGIERVTQHSGADGELKQQWVKSVADKKQAMAELIAALTDIFEPFRAHVPKIKAPKKVLPSNKMNLIPIGDAHIGLLAWWEEAGESFDLEIVERIMKQAFDKCLAAAPAAETLAIFSVGDYFHSDGGKNQTTKGTPVSVDGRWPQVLRVGLKILRYAIERGLETHQNVHVKCAAGNHDAEQTTTLVVALSMLFEGNPRVTFDEAPTKHHYMRFGKCLIGLTHSDTGKLADLPMVMAVDRPVDWGETSHRQWYCGHLHHTKKLSHDVQEMLGCTVEVVRTLAATDAWHKGQGYRSGRDMKIDTWDKEHGHTDRAIIGITMLDA